MFRLIGLGVAALGGWRAYQAHQAGVPIDKAFSPEHLFKPVDELAPPPPPALDPDALMVPDWINEA